MIEVAIVVVVTVDDTAVDAVVVTVDDTAVVTVDDTVAVTVDNTADRSVLKRLLQMVLPSIFIVHDTSSV